VISDSYLSGNVIADNQLALALFQAVIMTEINP